MSTEHTILPLSPDGVSMQKACSVVPKACGRQGAVYGTETVKSVSSADV